LFSLLRVRASNSSFSNVNQPSPATTSVQDLLDDARKDERAKKFDEAEKKYQQCVEVAEAQGIESTLTDVYLEYANFLYQIGKDSESTRIHE
jgi:hypothetical protein